MYTNVFPLFPSPLGVIFSLIIINFNKGGYQMYVKKFPSPLGVIFSLILLKEKKYSMIIILTFPSPLGVIFSLI